MKRVLLGFLLFTVFSGSCFSQYEKAIISVPLTNLRGNPSPIDANCKAPALSKDVSVQATQLLMHECVLVESEASHPNWYKAKALEQSILLKKDTWEPCLGYVKKEHVRKVKTFPTYSLVVNRSWIPVHTDQESFHVGLGTKFFGTKVNEDEWEVPLATGKKGRVYVDDVYELKEEIAESIPHVRNSLTHLAEEFLGSFYVWGGRSPSQENSNVGITGLDCSSFVNLVYRAHGFWVPPNTTSQFKKTTRVRSGKELQPGDVVFLADPKKSNRIFHIMLYLGNGNLIESIGSSPHNSVKQVKNAHDMKVRKVSIVERLGMPLEKVFSGKQYQAKDLSSIRTCTVFLGAFFKTKDDLKKMRQLERCPTPQAL